MEKDLFTKPSINKNIVRTVFNYSEGETHPTQLKFVQSFIHTLFAYNTDKPVRITDLSIIGNPQDRRFELYLPADKIKRCFPTFLDACTYAEQYIQIIPEKTYEDYNEEITEKHLATLISKKK